MSLEPLHHWRINTARRGFIVLLAIIALLLYAGLVGRHAWQAYRISRLDFKTLNLDQYPGIRGRGGLSGEEYAVLEGLIRYNGEVTAADNFHHVPHAVLLFLVPDAGGCVMKDLSMSEGSRTPDRQDQNIEILKDFIDDQCCTDVVKRQMALQILRSYDRFEMVPYFRDLLEEYSDTGVRYEAAKFLYRYGEKTPAYELYETARQAGTPLNFPFYKDGDAREMLYRTLQYKNPPAALAVNLQYLASLGEKERIESCYQELREQEQQLRAADRATGGREGMHLETQLNHVASLWKYAGWKLPKIWLPTANESANHWEPAIEPTIWPTAQLSPTTNRVKVTLRWDQPIDMDLEIWDTTGRTLLQRAFAEDRPGRQQNNYGIDIKDNRQGEEYFCFRSSTGKDANPDKQIVMGDNPGEPIDNDNNNRQMVTDYLHGDYVISVFFVWGSGYPITQATATLTVTKSDGQTIIRQRELFWTKGKDQWHAFRINGATGEIENIDQFINYSYVPDPWG